MNTVKTGSGQAIMKTTCTKYKLIAVFVLALLIPGASTAQLKDYGINLENYEYPFPVKFITLHIQQADYRMAYMDAKPGKANGKVVLLLHGKNFNGAYWKQTADRLLEKGYRVIMPDQLGFGKSSKPQCFQYSFQQLAENTKLLLDSLGISQTAVLGHSMGGMLAARFTLMYPGTATKLVLEDPIGLEDYKLKVPYQSVDDWYQKELKQTYESMKKYQLTAYYDNKWKPAYDEWLNMTAGWTLNKDYPLIAMNSALTYDMMMTQPVVYEFSRISAPTLLIIGQRDKTAPGKDLAPKEVQETMGNYPQLGKQTKEKIPGAELAEIADTGHLPHIESFDKFIVPLLAFLEK
ncbi:MAG: alpha/beta hydrolase [Bacteroidetes bacterium]|nr:alpha/beta hydrolase [Bacteroidota bacterium]